MSNPVKLIEPPVPHPEAPKDDVRLVAERAEDAAAVVGLIDRAFGPGRYAKVSERVREGNTLLPQLSFCAFGPEGLVGTVRQWPVEVGGASGVFLGPIAVEAAWRKHGVGGMLVERCCEAAAAAGAGFILLVGDLSFFGAYGFQQVPVGRVRLPGPVNPRRVLWRSLHDGAVDAVGGDVRAPRGDHG
jgi:predicted N-acetyltransferase YhbS